MLIQTFVEEITIDTCREIAAYENKDVFQIEYQKTKQCFTPSIVRRQKDL